MNLFEISFVLTKILNSISFIFCLFLLFRIWVSFKSLITSHKLYYTGLYVFCMIHNSSFFFPDLADHIHLCQLQGILNITGAFCLVLYTVLISVTIVFDILTKVEFKKYINMIAIIGCILPLLFVCSYYGASRKMEYDKIMRFCWINDQSRFYIIYLAFQGFLILVNLVLIMLIVFRKIIFSWEISSSKIENIKNIISLSINIIFFLVVTAHILVSYINRGTITEYGIFEFISDLCESFLCFSLLFIFKPANIFQIFCMNNKSEIFVSNSQSSEPIIISESESED